MKRSYLVAAGLAALVVGSSFYFVIVSAWSQQHTIRYALTRFQDALLGKTVDPKKQAAPHELADLHAQQRMADSAEFLAELTLAQLVVGVVGTLGLGVTLYFNFQALRQSGKQLVEAQKQTRLAQELGLIELRAYVSVEEFQLFVESPGVWRGKAVVRNRGQTPAMNVKLRMRLATVNRGDKDIPWDEAAIMQSALHASTIAAGGKMGPSGTLGLDEDFLARASQRKTRVHLAVLVEYEDVFGTSYRRRASISFFGENLANQAPSSEGNDEMIAGKAGFALRLEQSSASEPTAA